MAKTYQPFFSTDGRMELPVQLCSLLSGLDLPYAFDGKSMQHMGLSEEAELVFVLERLQAHCYQATVWLPDVQPGFSPMRGVTHTAQFILNEDLIGYEYSLEWTFNTQGKLLFFAASSYA